MKTLLSATLVTLAAIALAIPAIAAADGGDAVVKLYSLDVKERVQKLELINVTAEKPVAEDAEVLDAELAAILAETESFETFETE